VNTQREAEIRARWGDGGYRSIPASWEDEARELVERGSEDVGYLVAEVERLREERDRLADIEKPARELAGYVRSHLAGNDADPELVHALAELDEALPDREDATDG
jgi:hypothetical protein